MPSGIYKRTAKTRATLSAAAKRRCQTPEERERQRERGRKSGLKRVGIKLSPEHRANIGRGVKRSLNGRKPKSYALLHTAEARRKRDISIKKFYSNPANRAARSQRLKGIRKTQAHRDALSRAMKGRGPTPESITKSKITRRLRRQNDPIGYTANMRAAAQARGPHPSDCHCPWHLPQRGWHHTEETKLKMATSVQKRMWDGPPTCLERALDQLLTNAGFDFERQKRFGRYIVDVWIHSHKLAFEADGSFWHQDKAREALRDSYLIERGVTAIVHLDEKDLAPWI